MSDYFRLSRVPVWLRPLSAGLFLPLQWPCWLPRSLWWDWVSLETRLLGVWQLCIHTVCLIITDCQGFQCDSGLCLCAYSFCCNDCVDCLDLRDEIGCPWRPGYPECDIGLYVQYVWLFQIVEGSSVTPASVSVPILSVAMTVLTAWTSVMR